MEKETQKYLETVAPKSSGREEQTPTAGRLQGPEKGEQSPQNPAMVLGRELLALRQDLTQRLLSAPPLLPLVPPADALPVGLRWARL